MTKKLVFVYGSLLSGLGNHPVIVAPTTEFLGECETSPDYTMISLGAFPGVIVEGNTSIKGEVYAVSEDVYARVERLEGYPTFYGRTSLRTPLGDAEMYILPPAYLDRHVQVVEDGDWRGYVEGRGYRGYG